MTYEAQMRTRSLPRFGYAAGYAEASSAVVYAEGVTAIEDGGTEIGGAVYEGLPRIHLTSPFSTSSIIEVHHPIPVCAVITDDDIKRQI